jgi:hypothetical protein
MSWQGRPNWPPEWNGPYGPERPLPNGEFGTLLKAECDFGKATVSHCYIDIQMNLRAMSSAVISMSSTDVVNNLALENFPKGNDDRTFQFSRRGDHSMLSFNV